MNKNVEKNKKNVCRRDKKTFIISYRVLLVLHSGLVDHPRCPPKCLFPAGDPSPSQLVVAVAVTGLLPLHVACVGGHRRVVEFLVKAGSDARHASKAGVTPIQLADQHEHQDVVEVLQRYGARLDHDRGAGGAGGGAGWGGFVRDLFARMWTQSARSVDVDDMADNSLTSKRRRATIAETVVLANEPAVAAPIHKL